MEWQPIETAPMDTDVLVYREGRVGALPICVAGYFHNGEEPGWSSYDNMDEWIEGKPTYWMPLPAPPLASSPDVG